MARQVEFDEDWLGMAEYEVRDCEHRKVSKGPCSLGRSELREDNLLMFVRAVG